jgi:hypothetical protein
MATFAARDGLPRCRRHQPLGAAQEGLQRALRPAWHPGSPRVTERADLITTKPPLLLLLECVPARDRGLVTDRV